MTRNPGSSFRGKEKNEKRLKGFVGEILAQIHTNKEFENEQLWRLDNKMLQHLIVVVRSFLRG